MNARPTIAWLPFGKMDTGSFRLRTYQPCRFLQEAGVGCEVFNPANLPHYRLIVFQKAYAHPDDIAVAQHCKANNIKIILDLCDNPYWDREHPFPVADFGALSPRFRYVYTNADLITFSTPQLQQFFPQKPSRVIDDALDLTTENLPNPPEIAARDGNRFRLAWFGNTHPHAGLQDLTRILPELKELSASRSIELSVYTSYKKPLPQQYEGLPFPVRHLKWELETFSASFAQHDACLIPVTENPWTTCKTSNRVVVSLLHGVPVIADRLPSYGELEPFIQRADWSANIRRYAGDPTLCQDLVTRGSAYIRERFDKRVIARQWQAAIDAALGTP